MDDEYRGHGIVVNGVVNIKCFVYICVVQTNGIHETIFEFESISLYCFEQRYVTTIDLSFQIVLLPINGNNSSKWLGVTI